MKAYLLLLLLLLSPFGLFGFKPDTNTENSVRKANFKHGELLTYSLKYGFLHGGDATIQLNLTQLNNRKVFHASAKAKSVGLTDKLYKIEDIYESYFDPVTCVPYKAIRNISEGGYKYYNEVDFDRVNNIAHSNKNGKVKVPENILDMVSSLYYLRSISIDTLKKGDVIELTTYFGDGIFPFPLRYRGKEIIKTDLGKFICYRFDPVVEVGRIFDSEDDMTVWISADKNCIPIRVKFDMIVSAVYCDLTQYKNLVYELKSLEE